MQTQAVRALAEQFRIPRKNMLIVVDDSAIKLGRLRVRERGSSGGHNGLGVAKKDDLF